MVDANFSTLSLAPQELVSYMLDFQNKVVYFKQKNSCKYYDIITSLDKGASGAPGDAPASDGKLNSTTGSAGFNWDKFEVDTLPNI